MANTASTKEMRAARRVEQFQRKCAKAAAAARAAMALSSELRGERLMRPAEAAIYLGLSEKTLWYFRRWDMPPRYYRGGVSVVGYRRRDLDEWLANRRVQPKKLTGPSGA